MKAKTRALIIPIIPLTIPRGLLRQKDLPRSHYQRDVEPGSKVRLVALRPDHSPPPPQRDAVWAKALLLLTPTRSYSGDLFPGLQSPENSLFPHPVA